MAKASHLNVSPPPQDVVVILYPDSERVHAMSRVQAINATEWDQDLWAEDYKSRGFTVRKVSDAEYIRLAARTEEIRRAEHQAVMSKQPALRPIEIDLADVPPDGQKVLFRRGECIENDIEWNVLEEGLLVIDPACNLNEEKGVSIRNLDGGDTGWGYAGYERSTKTWWRYVEESKPGAYREHCMQIVELAP